MAASGASGPGSASSSNPRKFSEKIALQRQRQAEETAAFEEVMMEIGSTRVQKLRMAHMRGPYYGGSLPNVNQIGSASTEFQGPPHSPLDSARSTRHHGLVERVHRDPRRMMSPVRRYMRHLDSSPYGMSYLAPHQEQNWRRNLPWGNCSSDTGQLYRLPASLNRTNSDSALHTSVMNPSSQVPYPDSSQGTLSPSRRSAFHFSVPAIEENLQSEDSKHLLKPCDAKKLPAASSRPKSCEVPGINIYPSVDQPANIPQVPSILNTGGSLPDLTSLHFPSPLPTPQDQEESCFGSLSGGSSTGNLTSTMTHLGIGRIGFPPAYDTSGFSMPMQNSLSHPSLQSSLRSTSMQSSLSNSSLQSSLSNSSLQSSLSSQSLPSSLSNQSLSPSTSSHSLPTAYSTPSSPSSSCSSFPPLATTSMNTSPRRRVPLSPLTLPMGGEPRRPHQKQFSPTMSPTLTSITQGVPLDTSKLPGDQRLPSYLFNHTSLLHQTQQPIQHQSQPNPLHHQSQHPLQPHLHQPNHLQHQSQHLSQQHQTQQHLQQSQQHQTQQHLQQSQQHQTQQHLQQSQQHQTQQHLQQSQQHQPQQHLQQSQQHQTQQHLQQSQQHQAQQHLQQSQQHQAQQHLQQSQQHQAQQHLQQSQQHQTQQHMQQSQQHQTQQHMQQSQQHQTQQHMQQSQQHQTQQHMQQSQQHQTQQHMQQSQQHQTQQHLQQKHQAQQHLQQSQQHQAQQHLQQSLQHQTQQHLQQSQQQQAQQHLQESQQQQAQQHLQESQQHLQESQQQQAQQHLQESQHLQQQHLQQSQQHLQQQHLQQSQQHLQQSQQDLHLSQQHQSQQPLHPSQKHLQQSQQHLSQNALHTSQQHQSQQPFHPSQQHLEQLQQSQQQLQQQPQQQPQQHHSPHPFQKSQQHPVHPSQQPLEHQTDQPLNKDSQKSPHQTAHFSLPCEQNSGGQPYQHLLADSSLGTSLLSCLFDDFDQQFSNQRASVLSQQFEQFNMVECPGGRLSLTSNSYPGQYIPHATSGAIIGSNKQNLNSYSRHDPIPNIILTAVDSPPGFSKEITTALSCVPGFEVDQSLGLEEDDLNIEPLTLDGLHMLSDPYAILTDPLVEDSFRSDRLQ